jgi:hypothetical protein
MFSYSAGTLQTAAAQRAIFQFNGRPRVLVGERGARPFFLSLAFFGFLWRGLSMRRIAYLRWTSRPHFFILIILRHSLC